MDDNNLMELVIEQKQFDSYKMISRGMFSATIELDCTDKENKRSVIVLLKKESENRKFHFENIQNPYTVQALEYEYICRLQTYLIYTETGEYTLKDKVADKVFRKSPGAIETVFNWIKEASLGLKQLHSKDYVHLNIKTSSIIIMSDNRAKIGCLDFVRHTSTENER